MPSNSSKKVTFKAEKDENQSENKEENQNENDLNLSKSHQEISTCSNYLKTNYSNEEKITFANFILKSLCDKTCSINCCKCENYFMPTFMPYHLICGHSACFNCHKSFTSKICDMCINIKISNPSPIRDLLTFSVTIQDALTIIAQARDKPGLKMDINREGLVLSGLEELFEKAKHEIFVIKSIESNISTKNKKLDNAINMMDELALTFSKNRSKDNPLTIIENLINRLNNLIIYSRDMIPKFIEVELIIFSIIKKFFIREQDFYQIPTNKIDFTLQTMSSLENSQYNIWAFADIKQKPMYSKLTFANKCFTARQFQEFPGHKKDMYIIDYKTLLESCYRTGIYLLLKFDGTEHTHPLYLNIANSLFARQLFLLCSGERIASFKGGKGSSDENNLIVNSYLMDEREHSTDLIYGIPDVVGMEATVEAGSVYADRKLFEEVKFEISKVAKKNETRPCIGKLKWGRVSKIPIGEFTVIECGVIFQLPLPLGEDDDTSREGKEILV